MLLEIKNICKKYSSDFGIKNININLNSGESLALMGKSGSGKSTLLRLIALFEKADSGDVIYKGQERSKILLKDLGYIFQFPERQLFERTSELDIAFALKRSGLKKEEVSERVLAASMQSGFPVGLLPRNPFTLSGGEARKAALSGIYIKNPAILLLDEAASGLDSDSKQRLLKTMMEFKEKGAGIIAATHSSEEAALFDQILVLDRGRELFYGKTSEAFSSSAMARSISLDPPFALVLSERLKEKGLDVPITYREAELIEALARIHE